MDDRSVAGSGAQRDGIRHTEAEEQGQEQCRPCFFCLEGWVFLGSLDRDGEEVVEAIRCRQCKGTGVMAQERSVPKS